MKYSHVLTEQRFKRLIHFLLITEVNCYPKLGGSRKDVIFTHEVKSHTNLVEIVTATLITMF